MLGGLKQNPPSYKEHTNNPPDYTRGLGQQTNVTEIHSITLGGSVKENITKTRSITLGGSVKENTTQAHSITLGGSKTE